MFVRWVLSGYNAVFCVGSGGQVTITWDAVSTPQVAPSYKWTGRKKQFLALMNPRLWLPWGSAGVVLVQRCSKRWPTKMKRWQLQVARLSGWEARCGAARSSCLLVPRTLSCHRPVHSSPLSSLSPGTSTSSSGPDKIYYSNPPSFLPQQTS